MKSLKMKLAVPFFLFVVLILFGSCENNPLAFNTSLEIQGTVPGGASPSVSEGFRALGDPVSIPVTAADGVTVLGTLILTEAWVALEDIELEMDVEEVDTEEELSQEAEIEYEGPFLVNLMTNTTTPDLPDIDLLPGFYDEIEFSIDKIEGDETHPDGTPLVDPSHPIYGYSIYIAGTYTGSAGLVNYIDIPFLLAYDIEEEIELSGTDNSLGFIVEDGVLNPIIIAFRLNKWFNFGNLETNPDGVDFDDLVVGVDENGDDAIILDESVSGGSNNEKAREVIEENIEESADYGEDDDDDGELDSDEDDDDDSEDEEDS